MADRGFVRTAVAASLVVVGACSAAGDPVTTSAPDVLDEEPAGLVWSPCPDDQTAFSNQECATLTVPLDHDDVDLGSVELAVRRRPARDSQRIGSLVWIDGGPGYRGTLRLRDARFSLALTSRFDLVAWDPRGTSGDSQIDCPERRESLLLADPTPETEAEVEQNEMIIEEWAGPCRTTHRELLSRVGTYESARDLDLLRDALGDDEISILSGSYGTRVAVMYGTLFPDRVRAMVLDGYDDPNVSLIDHGLRLAGAFEEQLNRILDECSVDPDCPLHSDGDPAGALDELLDELDSQSLPGRRPGSQRVTEALTRSVIVSYLYSEPERRDLLEALALARAGDGAGLSRLFEQAVESNERGGITPETNGAIRCADRAGYWDAITVDDRIEFAEALELEAPTMAPSFGPTPLEAANYAGDCAIQPLDRSRLPETIDAEDAGTILVVGATGDTATPYEAALAATDDLDDARLVTVDDDRHTTYFPAVENPDEPKYACVLDAVHAYLIDLVVPTSDPNCTN